MRRVHHTALPSEIGVEFVLGGDEAHHLIRVLRARVGDAFLVFDGAGREVQVEVVAVGRREATLRAIRESIPRRSPRDVVLCTAIPRGQRMEWLIEKCTEAGVARIVPLATERGVRETVSANHLRRWMRSAAEAAKQCGRADVPTVDGPCSLAAALDEVKERRILLADPAAGRSLAILLVESPPGPSAVFIGPEGGFDSAESAALVTAGALPFALGALILRIETAAVVAVHALANAEAPPSGTPT